MFAHHVDSPTRNTWRPIWGHHRPGGDRGIFLGPTPTASARSRPEPATPGLALGERNRAVSEAAWLSEKARFARVGTCPTAALVSKRGVWQKR